jgi:DNA primase catalytic core
MRAIIESVKDSVPIESIVGETVDLKRSGSYLKGCCPLHNEKTPSFVVRTAAQTFYCYGCGKNGDVIQFVMERDGIPFLEALCFLAKKANIELPSRKKTEAEEQKTQYNSNLKTAAKAYQASLLKNQSKALTYWQSRGFLEETITDFGCGFAEGSEIDILMSVDIKRAIGVLHPDGKPLFIHRLTIPILDTTGNVIAWGARAIGTVLPKYLNSPTTDIYEKSKVLFNLAFARRYIRSKDEVILTEGYADVMICWQVGIRNVVATCGTSLTEHHIAELKRLCADSNRLFRVVLAFNNDDAGKKATLRAIPMLIAAGFAVKVAEPTKKDILDIFVNDGNEGVQQLFAQLKDGVNLLFQAIVNAMNPQTGAEIQEAAKKMCQIIAQLPENVRAYYIKIIAKWSHSDEISVTTMVSGFQLTDSVEKKGLRETDIPIIPAFPIHALPHNIRKIITDAEEWLAYPPDFLAAGILGAVAIASGRKVRLKYIWEEITCTYLLLVAAPGTNKTHPLKFALKPIADRDKAADQKFQKQKQRIANGLEEANKLMDCPQILFSDFTIEALSDGLSNHLNGIAAYVDEAASWVKNFDRYHKGSEQEFWLENWSGGALVVNRKGRKVYIDASSISFIGTIQPGLLDELSKNGRSLNGFVERIMFSMPEKVPVVAFKMRKERNLNVLNNIHVRYATILNRILDIEPVSGEDDIEKTLYLFLDENADDALTRWVNKQRAHLNTLENEFTRNIYSKIQTIGLRCSLILHLLEWASEEKKTLVDSPIEIETVLRATEIADYFLLNALKASQMMNFSSPIDKLPHNYKMWYRELPEEFGTADAERIAEKYNIARMTIYRMLKNQNVQQPMFRKMGHGKYEKMLY